MLRSESQNTRKFSLFFSRIWKNIRVFSLCFRNALNKIVYINYGKCGSKRFCNFFYYESLFWSVVYWFQYSICKFILNVYINNAYLNLYICYCYYLFSNKLQTEFAKLACDNNLIAVYKLTLTNVRFHWTFSGFKPFSRPKHYLIHEDKS